MESTYTHVEVAVADVTDMRAVATIANAAAKVAVAVIKRQ